MEGTFFKHYARVTYQRLSDCQHLQRGASNCTLRDDNVFYVARRGRAVPA